MRESTRLERAARCAAALVAGAFCLSAAAIAQYDDAPQDPAAQMESQGEASHEFSDPNSPMQKARGFYSEGKRQMKAAEKLAGKAEKAAGEERAEFIAKSKAELELAVGSLTSAVQHGPSFLDAYVALGEALRALGRYEEALRVHSAALARDKKSEANFRGYVLSLVAMQRLGNATALYEQFKVEQPKRAKFVLETLRQFHHDHQQNPAGLAPEDLDRLASWLAERANA